MRPYISLLTQSWKLIAGATIFGFFCSFFIIYSLPDKYQLIAQMKMAEIKSEDLKNFEDSDELMLRMKISSFYSSETVMACNSAASAQSSGEALVNLIKLEKPIRLNKTIVQYKILAKSKKIAVSCGEAIFGDVKNHQNNIIQSKIDERRMLLDNLKLEVQNIHKLISDATKSGIPFADVILLYRDQLAHLNSEIINLKKFIDLNSKSQTNLIAPFQLSDKPVFPNKKFIAFIGILAGFFLGLLLTVFKNFRFNHLNCYILMKNRWYQKHSI